MSEPPVKQWYCSKISADHKGLITEYVDKSEELQALEYPDEEGEKQAVV